MKSMTKEQLAESLNGNKYRDEMTEEQEQAAKQNNLLVLFGTSDDLFEMRGVIYDELDAYDGGEYVLVLDGELYSDDDEENTCHKAIGNQVLPLSDEYDNDNNPRLIRAEWCPDDQPALSWRIFSNMPYASFTFMSSEGKPYCEGIVIDIDEVAASKGRDPRTNNQIKFEEAARPLMEYLSELHPHHTVIVTTTTAELLEGKRAWHTDAFIKD